jgi:MHS family proline/betaine transporter-like MFS transporter
MSETIMAGRRPWRSRCCTSRWGLSPTDATIGVTAPTLLVAALLLQGLSAGGEVSGAASFVAEAASRC